MSKLLEIKKLSYTYKGDRNFQIKLEALELQKSQICALTGVSGSGKSTLLECLGLLREGFTAERFVLDNSDISCLDADAKANLRALKIGYMPQSGGLLPYLSFEDNLKLQIKLAHPDFNLKRVLEYLDALMPLLERFKLDKLLKHKAQALSIGQRQRAVFFRALAHHPKIVLIDEPTSALDPANAEKIFETMVECAESLEIAVVLVTHDVHLVSKYHLRNCAYSLKESLESLSLFRMQEGL